jgi:PAP2 superfamily
MQTTFLASIFHASAFRAAEFLRVSRKGIAAHGIFWMMLAAFYGGYLVLHLLRQDLTPINVVRGSIVGLWLAVPLVLFCIAVLRFYHVVRFDRPEQPTLAIIRDWAAFAVHSRRWANGLPIVFISVVFTLVFADIQGKTLRLNPAVWDESFASIDRIVHFGKQPWQWLQPILGHPYLTFLINLNYNIWYFVVWTVLVYFAFQDRPSQLRTQFFLSFLLTWVIGGSVLAIIFSSGGPCYYARLGLSPDPFADLMTYLRATNEIVPVWAVDMQDILWKGHLAHAELSEVSAMPSMHNATTLLLVLAAFRLSTFWGWVLALHAVLVFIGSIALAWHYAIDSYVAWALVAAIWVMMAPVARWWHQTADQQAFDRLLAD